MKDGFIKVCAATPDIRVADCGFNTENIIDLIKSAQQEGAKLIVLPELCVTGATCGDLFFQKSLLDSAKTGLIKIAQNTGDIIAVVGLPIESCGKLYNAAALLCSGNILALVPRQNADKRYFSTLTAETHITVGEKAVPFSTDIIIRDKNLSELAISVEVGADLESIIPPSAYHAQAGAAIIANPAACSSIIGSSEYTENLVKVQSARLDCGYIRANAGEGESTTDFVYSGGNIICECGTVLAKNDSFTNQAVYSELDLQKIMSERRKNTTNEVNPTFGYETVWTELDETETVLTRKIARLPFVPENEDERRRRAAEILTIQSTALKKRLIHTNVKYAAIGISGGLDSTLALLVTARAFDSAGLDRKGILAITMPCFGTTGRTYNNAVAMSKALGATLIEVDIRESVLKHFDDIGQSKDSYDVTYENSQARERTQVLMDIANKYGGLVVGTGDMSELALGWATYNGDHMSMYGVNAGVPKTLIRYLVEYEADNTDDSTLAATLRDILDTPVSPELLPPKDGEIAQKTESIVGPYSLHDFFLFHMLRYGFTPSKIYRLARVAFCGEFEADVILAWEKVFYRRFFSQQFKRSCVPDGPKVGTVGLSPRGDLQMPSDASWSVWQKELEELEKR